MIQFSTIVPIVLMTAVTYLTRVTGYALLRDRQLGPRVHTIMDAAPGCMLIAVIAPDFVSDQPADLIAPPVTIAAAMRFPLLASVVIGVASAGLLRTFL
jgi:uncharacterized membrane protein